jgi:hypothetical protein
MDQPAETFKGKSYLEKVILFVVFTFSCILLYTFAFQNDTYWLIRTGEYIIKNGFPTIDPLTFHDGLNYTPQQWLSAVIFYLLYSKFGTVSLYIMNIAVYVIMTFVIYSICMNLSRNNRFVSLIITGYTVISLSFYIVPRPQVFSIFIFILEIYILEKFIETDRPVYLIFLPLLSIALVNLHSAMWMFFFVLCIPYLIDGLNIKLWVIKTQGYRLIPLLFSLLASVAAGFINPYGIKNMLYVIYSYGNRKVNSSITEMFSPDFKEWFGIIVFALILLLVLIYIIVKSDNRLRYSLITIGTLYMGLASARSFLLVIGCAVPLLAYYMRNINLPAVKKIEQKPVWKKIRYILIATILILAAGIFSIKEYEFQDTMNDFRPVGAVDYIINNVDVSKMRLYNGYNTGGYIEFRGLKTFIDSRAEVFLKSLNKKDDIIIDYLNVRSGSMHYKKFIEKYSFTHFLVNNGESLHIYMREDPDYKEIYRDKKFLIYERVK